MLRQILASIAVISVVIPAPALAQGRGGGTQGYYGDPSQYYGAQPGANQGGRTPGSVPGGRGMGGRTPGTVPGGYQGMSGYQGMGSGRTPGMVPGGALSGRPGGSQSMGAMASEVESLSKQITQGMSSGDSSSAVRAAGRQQQLLRELVSMDPQNPRWKILHAITFIVQAGGPSRSGTAGDRVSLKMAIAELDAAQAMPGAAKYSTQINQLRTQCQQEVTKRQAIGAAIKRRGAKQFAEIYALPSVGGGGECANCRHWKDNATDRCGYCGNF